jgi:hypothetical protein
VDVRRLLIVLVTVGVLVLAFVPAVVTFGLGWLPLPNIQPWGAPPARDTTSLEAWTLFALFYLAWMTALAVLLVWSFDHLGNKWQPPERSPRPAKKERRRTRATMQAVAAEQQATVEAMRRREEREARRRREREAQSSGDGRH